MGGRLHYYKLQQWSMGLTFNIFNDISEHVSSVKFLDTVGNINHEVSIDFFYVVLIKKNHCL